MAKRKRRNAKSAPEWRSKQYDRSVAKDNESRDKRKKFFVKMAAQLGITPQAARQRWYDDFGCVKPLDNIR